MKECVISEENDRAYAARLGQCLRTAGLYPGKTADTMERRAANPYQKLLMDNNNVLCFVLPLAGWLTHLVARVVLLLQQPVAALPLKVSVRLHMN